MGKYGEEQWVWETKEGGSDSAVSDPAILTNSMKNKSLSRLIETRRPPHRKPFRVLDRPTYCYVPQVQMEPLGDGYLYLVCYAGFTSKNEFVSVERRELLMNFTR